MKETTRIEKFINDALEIDIRQNTRKRDVVEGRFLYAALAKKCTNLSLEKIGEHIGKNHATIIHSIKVYNTCLKDKYKSLYDVYYYNYLTRTTRENKDKEQSLELKQLTEVIKLKSKIKILNKKLADVEDKNSILNIKLTERNPLLSDYYDLSKQDQQTVKERMEIIIRMLPSKQKRKEEFEIINCSM